MRKISKLLKLLSLAPLIVAPTLKTGDFLDSDTQSSELKTSIDKIFLTSEHSEYSDYKVFSFDAENLGREIVSHLDLTLGRRVCTRFNDGEINIQLKDSVRGHEAIIIKSFEEQNINDGIMELILAVSCMKKQGAEFVSVILPYLPYTTSTVEQTVEGSDFYTCFASDIVKMLQSVGCDRIVTINPGMTNPKGFAQRSHFMSFNASEIVIPYLAHKDLVDPVLVGAKSTTLYLKRIQSLQQAFSAFQYTCGFGFFNGGVQYIGEDVRDRDVVIYKNLIRSNKNIDHQVRNLKKRGARKIYYYAFHGLCPSEQLSGIVDSLPIDELIVTNSISHSQQSKKIRTLSLAKLLAQVISILVDNKSLNEFRLEREIINYAYLKKMKSINLAKKGEQEQNRSKNPDVI